MARPLRIEYAGAVYHLSSKAEAGAVVFSDDDDRRALLAVIAQAMQRFDAQVLAYHLGRNHYELVLYTRQANLSRLMRHLNGVYTQGFNRRHGGHGHLFQGRFKAVLVDREKRLLDVCRYVELGAVREGLASSAPAWPWSSHRAHCCSEPAPQWLDVDGLLGFVLDKPIAGVAERKRAAQRYEKLVASEPGMDIWPHLRHQVFLGDAEFAAAQRQLLQARGRQATRAASGLRGRGWRDWLRDCASREEALYRAHTDGGMSMTGLAQELALSVSRVSRLIAAYERTQRSH